VKLDAITYDDTELGMMVNYYIDAYDTVELPTSSPDADFSFTVSNSDQPPNLGDS